MKIKITKSLLIIMIVFFINITKSYGYYNVKFENITNEDGLSQATVETIIQDKNGYMWIGTNDGLNRYNGYDFDIFKYNEELENTIANSYIIDLQQDNDGNMWVGTANGLSKINLKNDKVTNYTKEKSNLSDNNIGDILITKRGDIIIGTSNGINIYDKEKDDFRIILDNKNSITDQLIYSLEEDGNGDIWIGTKNGLNKVDIKNKKIYKFYEDGTNKSISGNKIYKVYYDKKGYIWVGTFENGLNRIDINTHDIKQYIHNEKDINSIGGNLIRDILRESNGTLWIATENGLCRYDEDKDNFYLYQNKVYDKDSLVNDSVFSLIEDSTGLIWVGTYGGISIFDSDNKIEHYKKDYSNDETLSENVIHGIYEDQNKLVWVGTNSKGLNVLNRDTGKVININKNNTNGKFTDDSVNVIAGKDNIICIGTNNGLNIIEKDKRTLYTYSELDGLNSNKIMALMMDNNGYLWIGGPSGINIININTREIINLNDILSNNGINNLYVREIYQDKEGIYWVGSFTDDGLIKINPVNRHIKSYKTEENDKTTISSNTVRSIQEDKLGNLWIGTSHGLNKFNKENEKFIRYLSKDGLPNNVIYGILIDEKNNPWMSTNLGISKLNIKENKFENFGISDGFQGNEFNGSAYYKNNKGEFFFGGINGLNVFDPKDINKANYTPKVRFDKFQVNGRYYSDINKYKFKYNENFINIKVSIPDYRNMENIQYIYKIEGATEHWNITESNNINYSNLYPGNYILKIKARSHTGAISEESSIKFSINPPIYKSKVAIALYILIIILKINYYMDVMSRNTKRLLNLINNIIDTAKIEHGNYQINLKPNDIVYVVEEAALSLKDYIENKEISLIIDPKIEEKVIMCDEYEIDRCIVNLVSNAAKFTPQGGTIEVSIKEHIDNIVITVEDTGIGIDPKYHKVIFDRFNQVDDEFKVKGGSGLGLTITKHIIELHGGNIYVESEINKGTKFTIII